MPHLHEPADSYCPELVYWFTPEPHTCPYWPGIKSQHESLHQTPVFTPFCFPRIWKDNTEKCGLSSWRKKTNKAAHTMGSGGFRKDYFWPDLMGQEKNEDE